MDRTFTGPVIPRHIGWTIRLTVAKTHISHQDGLVSSDVALKHTAPSLLVPKTTDFEDRAPLCKKR